MPCVTHEGVVANPYLPMTAEVVERVQESATVFTLRLRFTDPDHQAAYRFAPGQFNMVHLPGVGEVAISIVSDPRDEHLLDHSIRMVGRVTHGLAELRAGDQIGLRGPYGRGWPLDRARGRDILLITGGLGCAPLVSVINYIVRRRDQFGRLVIMQGVKHANDLIYRDRYEAWAKLPDTRVLIAADQGTPLWTWHVGHVTNLFDQVDVDPARSIAMLCGPEGMMRAAIGELHKMSIGDDEIYLSMERNMHCGFGHCGHCQYGPKFVCRDGPVFAYSELAPYFPVRNL